MASIKGLVCQIEEKDTFKKQVLEITKSIYIQENMKTEKLERYLLIQARKENWLKL